DRVVVTTSRAAKATEITATTRAADDALIAAASAAETTQLPVVRRFRTARLLARHFKDHGHDFGAASSTDYANRAVHFFEQGIAGGLPRKIDEFGTIRLYDPASNTFGSYSSDGTILTFFKPSSPTYWLRQSGS
ncbi:MAG: hypothetical protein ACRDWT_06300, partial [Jatrophihabitantaceae bacterium]